MRTPGSVTVDGNGTSDDEVRVRDTPVLMMPPMIHCFKKYNPGGGVSRCVSMAFVSEFCLCQKASKFLSVRSALRTHGKGEFLLE